MSRGHDSPWGKPTGVLCACGCGQETRRYGTRVSKYVDKHAAKARRGQHSGYLAEDRGYDTKCWIWQGGSQEDGYGRMSVNRRNVPAHRAYYEQLVGPIPDGLTLDHLCRVPACVNPAHLEPVTFRVNRRRSSHTLLTVDDVVAIKKLLKPHVLSGRVPDGIYAELAEKYGVAKGTIRSIRKGGSWSDVVV